MLQQELYGLVETNIGVEAEAVELKVVEVLLVVLVEMVVWWLAKGVGSVLLLKMGKGCCVEGCESSGEGGVGIGLMMEMVVVVLDVAVGRW